MFMLHPDLVVTHVPGALHIEDREVRLTFEGKSVALVDSILRACVSAANLDMLARESKQDLAAVAVLVEMLEAESFFLRMDYPDVAHAEVAIEAIKRSALFWNKHVMAQHFLQRLFGGEASRTEVLGWGIEFYHFVRAAREYMARGASRIDGPTSVLAELWDHFAEEAFHDGMFLDGLVACGLDGLDIERRQPLASTMALLNHLWEAAEEGDLEYASVFAVMQPSIGRPSPDDIRTRYNSMREWYPFARPLFDAFERHDLIDVELEHLNLTLEPLLRSRRLVTREDLLRLTNKVRSTAEFFDIFFEGIQPFYKSEINLQYRQIPNASAINHSGLERLPSGSTSLSEVRA